VHIRDRTDVGAEQLLKSDTFTRNEPVACHGSYLFMREAGFGFGENRREAKIELCSCA